MNTHAPIIEPDLFTTTFGEDFWDNPVEDRFRMVLGLCCQTVDHYGDLAKERKPNEFTRGFSFNAKKDART